MDNYISISELESQGRISYTGVVEGSEPNHRKRMQEQGKELYVSPKEVSFAVETHRCGGIGWWHHLYPDKRLVAIKGKGEDIRLLDNGRVVEWGLWWIVHSLPKSVSPKRFRLELIFDFSE